MAYDQIANSEIDQDSPVTQPLLTKLRDNADFMWPAFWHPYDMAYPEDGTDGVLYDSAVDTPAASVESPVFDDGFDYRLICSESATTPRIEFFKAVDSAYSAAANVDVGGVNANEFDLELLSPFVAQAGFSAVGRGRTSSTFGVASVGFQDTTIQAVTRLRVSVLAGNLSGVFRLLKRKVLY